MARTVERQVRDDTKVTSITLDSFKKGYINLTDETRLPPDAASEATNLVQVQDGVWSTRWGVKYYGMAAPNGEDIDGAFSYDNDGTTELIIVAGGNVYKSVNGGTQTQVTGATLTAGLTCRGVQIRDFLYIINGTDDIVRYDGSTLSTYTALSNPGAPTPTRGAGLSSGNYTYYYQIVATNAVGFTAGGTEGSISVNKVREDFSGSTEYIDLSWSRVTGALRYDIYVSDRSGFEVYLDSVPDPGSGSVTYRDDGSVAPNDLAEVPTDNTTAGPTVGVMEISGNRLWGTLDDSNRQRVYWTGSGQYQGYFSPFYGGGYIDLEKGGVERPYAVVDYRDGKGTPTTIVLTSDPQGVGSRWQIALETATIGDTTFLVPNAQKLGKSAGTGSPSGVVKANNDIFFPNQRGVFSLGSKPNQFNILVTDEVSDDIRPYWRSLNKSGIEGISGYFYDAKVFFAVPKSGSTNSHIVVYDTERTNWAVDWDVPVKQFLEYTDSGGTIHFLAVPASGSQMYELADNVYGDLGAGFDTQYASPLLPVAKDRTAWAQITNAVFEFGDLVGEVTVQVRGTQKSKDFQTVSSRTVSDTQSNAGFGANNLFSSNILFSEVNPAPVTFSSSSLKKFLKVNKLLNNVQFLVSSSNNNVKYTLLSIKANGFEVPTGAPSSWKE